MRQETPSRGALWSRPAPAAALVLAAALVACGAALAVVRARGAAATTTGGARWIWYSSRVPKPEPIRFYATCDVDLPGAPARAKARVFVDREHVLYVNGERAGAGTQKPGDALAVYEIGRFLRPGSNRITIEAASPSGIGGILFALESDGRAVPAAASGPGWRVDLDAAAVHSGGRERPVVWGPPPQYPWGYPGENR